MSALCPECGQKKCGNCNDTALDPVTDKITVCSCYADGHPPVAVAPRVVEGTVPQDVPSTGPSMCVWIIEGDVQIGKLLAIAGEVTEYVRARIEVDIIAALIDLGGFGRVGRGQPGSIVAVKVGEESSLMLIRELEVRQ